MSWSYIAPILLLSMSNVFMTFAWYGQLKFPRDAAVGSYPRQLGDRLF